MNKKKYYMESLKMKCRALEHNLKYKEHYSTKVMVILLTLLILDLIGLYLVW